MLIGIGLTRDLLRALDEIDDAGRLDELEERVGRAQYGWREWQRTAGSDDRSRVHRLAAIASRHLGTSEYDATLRLAADELSTWPAVYLHVVTTMARECREASRNAV